ncbi:hypothetical protein ACP4OV_031302 [Aristida adscensionis]
MCPLDVEAGGVGGAAAGAAADMAEATRDAAKLRRALVAGGVGQAAAALYMALFRPPAGVFLRAAFLRRSYYGVLAAVVVAGVAEAWAGLWLSREPRRRRAAGVAVLWASVLPLLLLAGVGGFAILK